jgi:hypothetical protein
MTNSVLEAFAEWYGFHHRGKKKDLTPVEKMLAGDLPRSHRFMLEARRQARISLYNIESIEPGVGLNLRDILFGGTLFIHDVNLAATAKTGIALPLRTYDAGNFHFAALLGPALPSLLVPEAVDFLESQGLEADPAGATEKAHLWGRLWEWQENRREALSPYLEEEDEDDGIVAVFRVKNKGKVKKALLAHPEIEYDEVEDEYIWIKSELDSFSGAEEENDIDPVGFLWFKNKELYVDVVSEELLEEVRTWLEAIPGITLNRLESPVGPEEWTSDREEEDWLHGLNLERYSLKLEDFQAIMNNFFMKCLDLPFDFLNGQSLRQMCRTPQGRRKVAIMIRSLPSPPATTGLTVPRVEMLKALGLGEE